ncbi:MAG: putative selenium-dependent hydroxylase accessory protein YqeC [Synergistaceae bacterium]|jgi:probable selenium-dependent hydroxylase accessory protein YqeC|nr:putative selenium-dependent hydroxylase accessory protein YqeC [Synergistaceae bacterium]
MVKLPTELAAIMSECLPARAVISITGGGGKTSLAFILARHFSENGKNVVLTTTTKICRPYPFEVQEIFFSDDGLSDFSCDSYFQNGGIVGSGVCNDQLIGISPEAVDTFVTKNLADCIIVEADGARGFPFKGYESYEPLIPKLTALHIVMVGAEILIEPFSASNSFRSNLLEKRWHLKEGEIIPFRKLSAILGSQSEYLKNSPETAMRLLLFNKCDLIDETSVRIVANNLWKLLRGYDRSLFLSLRAGKSYFNSVFVTT